MHTAAFVVHTAAFVGHTAALVGHTAARVMHDASLVMHDRGTPPYDHGVIAALTGSGLAAAAGLNAYIPFLIVAVLARTTEIVQLPPDYAWVQSNWAIGAGSVLLVTELVLDKIPVVDHLNDTVATLIRPTVGGLIFSATSSAENLDSSQWMRDNPWAGIILGVLVAGLTHAAKATVRPAVNVSTAGTGAPVVSAAEDVLSAGLSLVAIFAPVLVVVVLLLLAWAAYRLVRWLARRRRGTAARPRLDGA